LLLELKVNNLGIIEDMDWSLDKGLNVITGETGAGKSLIIDAIELLLVAKMDEQAIRTGANEARIEGVFGLTMQQNLPGLRRLLAEKGLADDETLIISCEIRRQRPGLVRINGQIVPKSLLRQVGSYLVDIHGQSDHLSLLDKSNHLDVLDSYGRTWELRDRFEEKAAGLKRLLQEVQTMAGQAADRSRLEELLRFQIEEIRLAGLRDGEEEELEKERRIISFGAKLKEFCNQAYQALYEGDTPGDAPSAFGKLNEAAQAFRKLVDLDSDLKPHLEFLEKAIFEVEDAARDIRAYGDKLEHDPKRVEEIENRLQLVRNLKKKYGQSIPEILAYLEKSEKDLDGLTGSTDRVVQLGKRAGDLKKEMGCLAVELSAQRCQAARRLEINVRKELTELEMAHVGFEVAVTRQPSPEGIPCSQGETCAFSQQGIDSVEFMVSTNPGEPLKPLAKIASTGEMSRLTLALKGALSEADNVPVLIFDEIDIGVGGRSGETIGRKLWALSRNHQVVCVTHLGQIAAYADAHFGVHKEMSGERTLSLLKDLRGDSRLEELAVMLFGRECSAGSLSQARELMEKAERWKAGCLQRPGTNRNHR
jgi:DNA repair protein RecN (Recombination protein N)